MMGVGVGILSGSPALMLSLFDGPYPWMTAVFSVVSRLWLVVLVHLLLAFPGGRLVTRLDRIAVGLFYAVAPLPVLLDATVVVGLPQVGVIRRPPVIDGLASAANFAYLACFVIGLGLVIRRWVLGGRARRRSMSPMFWPMVLVTACFLLFAATSLIWRSHVDISILAAVSSLIFVALPVGFVIGLLRSGLDMSSVGGLVVKLSGGLAPELLQPALAYALHDPSLEVGYWLPSQERFADLEGNRIELPSAEAERAVSVLEARTARWLRSYTTPRSCMRGSSWTRPPLRCAWLWRTRASRFSCVRS